MLSVRLHPQRGPCRPSRNVLAASSRGGGRGGRGVVGGRGQRQKDAKVSRGDEALDPKDTRASASNLSDDDFDDFDDDDLSSGSDGGGPFKGLSSKIENKGGRKGPPGSKRLSIQVPQGDKFIYVTITNQSQLDALLDRTSALGLSDEVQSADTENDHEDIIVDFDMLADRMTCRFVMLDVDDFFEPEDDYPIPDDLMDDQGRFIDDEDLMASSSDEDDLEDDLEDDFDDDEDFGFDVNDEQVITQRPSQAKRPVPRSSKKGRAPPRQPK